MYYNYGFPGFTAKFLSRVTGKNWLLLELLIFLPASSYFIYNIQVYIYTLLRILDYYNLMLTVE